MFPRGLGIEGVQDTVVFRSPANPEFVSLVALNPNPERNKVEYRFYNDQLFHIEVYYSDFYANESFVSFLLNLMSEYGKPYEISTKVDELGNVNLHVRWDTDVSMIEMVSRAQRAVLAVPRLSTRPDPARAAAQERGTAATLTTVRILSKRLIQPRKRTNWCEICTVLR